VTYRVRPCTEPHDGHIVRVAAKRLDVVPHPLQQHLLIPQPQIQQTLSSSHLRRQETQCADAVVEVNSHHGGLVPGHKARHVALGPVAGIEAAAMDIHGDGQARLLFHDPNPLVRIIAVLIDKAARAVDVRIQAVLAHVAAHDPVGRADLAPLDSVKGLCGFWQRLRRAEAVLAGRVLGVGHAAEGVYRLGKAGGGGQRDADVGALAEGDAGC
jgi:hypothetical protein